MRRVLVRVARTMRTIAGHCLLVSALFSSGGCQREEPTLAPPLAIADDKAALEFMARFFKAYVNIDVEACMEMLCPTDEATASQVRAFIHETQKPASPFRVNAFQVRSVELMWQRRAPMHRVEVSFPRRHGTGQILHVYSVRAREGCLEGFLDPPTAGEMMPRASEELLDDEGAHGIEEGAPSSTIDELAPEDGARAPEGEDARDGSIEGERETTEGAPRDEVIEL